MVIRVNQNPMNTEKRMRKYINNLTLLVVTAAISIVYFSLGWSDQISSLGGDSSAYLLAAQYYSPYQASSAVAALYMNQIISPPLFPALLSLLGGGEHILIAHEIVICCLLAAMCLLYWWARAENLSMYAGIILVVTFAIMPATYLTAFNIWTENLYLMFSLMAAAALSYSGVPRNRALLIAALAVSGALLTRTAALPLAFAFLVYLAHRRPRSSLLLAAVAFVPYIAWAIFNASVQSGSSSYISQLEGKYLHDPVAIFLAQLSAESGALAAAWFYAWLGESPTLISKIIVSLFAVIALHGWLVRVRNLKFDAIYVSGYSAMLMAWPHPEEALRYSYVLFPFLLFYGYQIIARIPISRISKQPYNIAIISIFVILLVSMVPTLFLNIKFYFEAGAEGYEDNKHTAEWYSYNRQKAWAQAVFRTSLLNHLSTLPATVPESECIFSIKPPIVTLYAKRISYATPKSTLPDGEFMEAANKCRFVYVLPFASPSYNTAFYPLARLGAKARLISEKRMADDQNSQLVGALYEIVK